MSLSPYRNKINNGLVIKQDSTLDEYVWIKVPKEILENRVEDAQIEEALKAYTKEYRQDGYEDVWYDGCGMTQTEYNTLKSKMLQSIKANGGFYIGRYEAGIDNPKTSGNTSETVDSLETTNGLPQSQIDKYPYNYITCNQAQKLIQKLDVGSHSKSLMFGIQWDLVCKFIENTQTKNKEEIKEDSLSIGNYTKAEFILTHGGYYNNSLWNTISGNNKITKATETQVLLTTGASKRNAINNIYDLAGNVGEYTLEKSNNTGIITYRGGKYNIENSSLNNRSYQGKDEQDESIGFRVTIF